MVKYTSVAAYSPAGETLFTVGHTDPTLARCALWDAVTSRLRRIFTLCTCVSHCVVKEYGSTALVDLGRFFSSLILYTVGRTPSMPRVGFEPTIPAFERPKTVHMVGVLLSRGTLLASFCRGGRRSASDCFPCPQQPTG
jgi:hypothetical protein